MLAVVSAVKHFKNQTLSKTGNELSTYTPQFAIYSFVLQAWMNSGVL